MRLGDGIAAVSDPGQRQRACLLISRRPIAGTVKPLFTEAAQARRPIRTSGDGQMGTHGVFIRTPAPRQWQARLSDALTGWAALAVGFAMVAGLLLDGVASRSFR